MAFGELAFIKVGKGSTHTEHEWAKGLRCGAVAAAILVLAGGSEVGSGKDNMSRGSNEQMFGKKDQVTHGGQATKNRSRSGVSFCTRTGKKQ